MSPCRLHGGAGKSRGSDGGVEEGRQVLQTFRHVRTCCASMHNLCCAAPRVASVSGTAEKVRSRSAARPCRTTSALSVGALASCCCGPYTRPTVAVAARVMLPASHSSCTSSLQADARQAVCPTASSTPNVSSTPLSFMSAQTHVRPRTCRGNQPPPPASTACHAPAPSTRPTRAWWPCSWWWPPEAAAPRCSRWWHQACPR